MTWPVSVKRLAARAVALDKLGPRPPWWRIFARRRWSRRYASIMAMDVTTMGELFAHLYPVETIEQLAQRKIDFLTIKVSR